MHAEIIRAFRELPGLEPLLPTAGSEAHGEIQFDSLRRSGENLLKMWRSGEREQRRSVLDALLRLQGFGFSRPIVTRSTLRCLPEYARLCASLVEEELLNDEAVKAEGMLAGKAVPSSKEFGDWFRKLIAEHPVAHHPLYERHFRYDASRQDFRYLLAQESTLDPRFDDIVALMQIGASVGAKLEYARNYWDEMGCGDTGEVHSRLFANSLSCLDVDDAYRARVICYEAQVTGVLSAALALKPDWYAEAMGYFGVTEYLVPRRMKAFIEGWKRLNLPLGGDDYQRLHVRIDAEHAAGWIRNVIVPAVLENGDIARRVAAGALMRLESSQRYLDEVTANMESKIRNAEAYS
jgi:hypothetical protein